MGIAVTPRLPSGVERVLISSAELQQRLSELSNQIAESYQDKQPFIIGILKGSLIFLSDLIRLLPCPLEIDFIAARSYGGGTTSSGQLEILKDLDTDIAGRDVLIVEDIVDTGHTLSALRQDLLAREPASLSICALLSKPSRRTVEVPLDYVGFTIPDEFVVGYGLDYAGLYRNLPFVGVLSRSVYEAQEE